MQTFNFLKPNRDNIKNYSIIGSFLVLVSLIDVISNAFLKINSTFFLPGFLANLFPLIICNPVSPMINGNKVVKEPGKKDVKFIFKKAFDITSIKLTKTKKDPIIE